MSISKPIRRATAVVATTTIAVVSTLAVTGGVSGAATIDKTVNYSCNLPIVGVQTIPVRIRATFPDSVVAGGNIVATATSDISVPANVAAALPILSATSADLHATLHTTWTGAIAQTVDATVDVVGAAPPASGPWVITATAQIPPVAAPTAGVATGQAGNIDLVLTLRKADGTLTGLGVVNTACTLVAGQDTTLTSITVTPRPVPTTVPPTNPPTTAPTTVPPTVAPTTVPPTTPTTRPATTVATTAPPASSSTVASTVPPTSPSTVPATTVPAPPPGPLTVTYGINGSARIKKLGLDAPIGPGTLTAALDLATGRFSGDLAVPESHVSMKVLGLPLSANFGLKQVGKVNGSLVDGKVAAQAKADIMVSQLKLGRLALLRGTCTTVKPANLALASEPGFDVIQGGSVSGTFTIPKFGGCGLIGLFVNLLIPGSGNTINLNLAPAAG